MGLKRKAVAKLAYLQSQPKLLVLDLNGVLIRRIERSYVLRPYVREFIKHFARLYRLATWTSISKANANLIVKDLFGDLVCEAPKKGKAATVTTGSGSSCTSSEEGAKVELLFTWYQQQCVIADEDDGIPPDDLLDPETKPVFLKPLQKIWSRFPLYNNLNTIILDDSPEKMLKNDLALCVQPSSFDPSKADSDEELKPGSSLWQRLEELASSFESEEKGDAKRHEK